MRRARRDFAGCRECLAATPPTSSTCPPRRPRRLKEEERRKLARYFAVPGRFWRFTEEPGVASGLIAVKRHAVAVSAVSGDRVRRAGAGLFRLRGSVAQGAHRDPPAKPSIVRVEDPMAPLTGETTFWSTSATSPIACATGFMCCGSMTRVVVVDRASSMGRTVTAQSTIRPIPTGPISTSTTSIASAA